MLNNENNQVKIALQNGINKVADAVKVTAGAEGKIALIEQAVNFPPHATKDGVTIARNIFGDTEYEQLGCDMIKEALNKTVEQEADGTTTTAILTQALVNLGIASGKSHIKLREELKEGYNTVEEFLNITSKTVETLEDKIKIASVSANNDEEIGTLIATVFDKIGVDSTIKVEQGAHTKDSVEYVEGIQLEKGMIYPHFATDYLRSICEFNKPLVFIFSGNISTVVDIKEQVEEAVDLKKPLVIICDNIEDPVISELFDLKKKGILQVCIVLSPDWGEKRMNILEDLGAVTGASLFEPNMPTKIFLGDQVEKVIISNYKTVFIPANKEDVDDRVEYLNEQLDRQTEEDVKLQLKTRIANLTSAVAKITVGGVNDVDIKERKDRFDDAVGALRSALIGGYVSGGGSALYYVGQENKNNIVFEAIKQPMLQILENADITTEGERNLKYLGQGVDVLKREVVDMYEQGIIDSKNVQLTALKNAIAVANTVFQTEVLIKSNLYYGK